MRDASMEEVTGDPLVGKEIAGKYVIEKQLGVGAMGAVYRARHVGLDKVVAIKVMHRHLLQDPSFASRFASEAKAASRLDHPSSIRVFDYGEEADGLLYIAMEYVEGRDLYSVIEDGILLPAATIIEILSQVLAALAVAHDMGVLHRDLKPENIMVLRGTNDEGAPIDIVKVCDFGIAKIIAEPKGTTGRRHSTGGTVVGTPAYISPEQARGATDVDARSDLYSVGVVLYVLLTGREPFTAETPIAIVLKHVTEDPPRPSEILRSVDPLLEAICLKALRKDPKERYQDARSMRQALRDAASAIAPATPERRLASRRPPALADTKLDIAPVVQSAPHTGVTPKRRWPLVIPILAAAIAATVAGLYLRKRPRPPAAHEEVRTEVSSASATVSAIESAAPPPTASATIAKAKPRPRRSTTKSDPPPPPVVETSAPAPPPPPEPPPPPPPVEKTAPPPPAEPAFDPNTGRVDIGQPANMTGGLVATVVSRMVRGASPQINACYRTALARAGTPVEGASTLHIETDGAGVITDARVQGALAASTSRCIGGLFAGRTLSGVDTGTASADVPLVFKAR